MIVGVDPAHSSLSPREIQLIAVRTVRNIVDGEIALLEDGTFEITAKVCECSEQIESEKTYVRTDGYYTFEIPGSPQVVHKILRCTSSSVCSPGCACGCTVSCGIDEHKSAAVQEGRTQHCVMMRIIVDLTKEEYTSRYSVEITEYFTRKGFLDELFTTGPRAISLDRYLAFKGPTGVTGPVKPPEDSLRLIVQ